MHPVDRDDGTAPLEVLIERAHDARRAARWSEAEALFTLALREALRRDQGPSVVELHNSLGAIAFETGAMQDAERRFGDALRAATEIGEARGEAAALVNLGAVANVRGKVDQALHHYRRGRWAYRRAGSRGGEARALNNLGMVLADLQRWRTATRCYRRARDLAAGERDDELAGLISINETEVWLALEDIPRARISCDEAERCFSRVDDSVGMAEVSRFRGEIERGCGRLRQAEAHFRDAADRGRILDAPLTEAEALRELGHLHLTQGRHRQALECFGRSIRLFRGLEAARDLAEVGGRIEELEAVIVKIVQQIGREVETRDTYLYGHSSRVAEYAVAIACDLGFGAEEMKGILVAGYLHDVGKLHIEPAILNKEGRLTEAEMAEVRRHPVLGIEHLVRFELPWDVEATIRGHHERYDGTGYPDGLAGERIPLGARILLVADVFDALTTARSYRNPWGRDQALTYLRMSAGTLSDPAITELFIEIAQREAYGPDTVGRAAIEHSMSPEALADAFAALPSMARDWRRLDEELALT